jgi:hypothetical protein
VHPSVERLYQIALRDLDPEFIEAVAIAAAWAYSALHDEIAAEPDVPDAFKLEEFTKRRSYAISAALRRSAIQRAIPYEFMRLDCNGQRKLMVKAGRVIIIQEPILTLEDHPRPADYKIKLASIHGLMRQSEFDLGDFRRRIHDWSGCVLGVLLHGAAGPKFTPEHRRLGSLMLGITDAEYSQWVLRADLHQIALYGRAASPKPRIIAQEPEPVPDQPDNVIVTPRKKKIDKETA